MQPILRSTTMVGASCWSTAMVSRQTFRCHSPTKNKLDIYQLHMKYKIPSPPFSVYSRVSSPTRQWQSLQPTPTPKIDIEQLRMKYRIPEPPFPVYSRQEKWNLFERWMIVFGKVYANVEEKMRRFEIFSRTMERLNKDPSVTIPDVFPGCKVGLNVFSDAATPDEVFSGGLVRYRRKIVRDPRTGLESQSWEPILDQFGKRVIN